MPSSNDLTPDQARRLFARISRDCGYYHRLVKRMEERRWDGDDHIYRRAVAVAEKLDALRADSEQLGSETRNFTK